ncbi:MULTISPECIES: DUF805 domain-containing protein [Staphylococcus]|uniref:DUF805 domain-containing protein n=1 Tax=Staphylococcus TaxID=1279 RepID=UPI0003914FE7|nr:MULTISPECIES: DUF805 domain-containing protein [Staphylococcus]ERF48068.1 hypothetical protein N039_05995 [Staphylococcus sp. EGD-HP3]MCD8815629.1 DUF805 domain-containing protein [Staphylococcus arlettae]MCD8839028.1 DUF805 domain-containing protein [Staphylococcus arlettae]MCD8864187.1 DUF805 domain-containing protein [Staphylococcus arlettae]MCD8866646.1 DUF805 domain-containing protein [Staphylococcus arlettae]
MVEAYTDFWKRYIDFKSKSNRTEFWVPVLVHILVIFILSLIGAITFVTGLLVIAIIIFSVIALFLLANIVPMIAITMRRFYDAGRKRMTALMLILITLIGDIIFDIIQIDSLAILMNIITLISTIILIVITLLPTKPNPEAQLKWI